MQNKNIIVGWKTSRWLVCSSLLFMVPSIYAFYLHLYFFSGLLLITSAVSANHWRDALFDSQRRTIDRMIAKLSFVIFMVDGVMHIRYIPYICVGYANLVAIVYCYKQPNDLYLEQHSTVWYKYHMMFHFCVMCEQLLVIISHPQIYTIEPNSI